MYGKLATKIGTTLGACVLAVGGIAVSAGPASAGGCSTLKGGCGTVVNNQSGSVTTCVAWHGDGPDQAYQTSGYCSKKGKVAGFGHSVGTHDVDAIYIPKGQKYTGAIYSHSKLPLPSCKGSYNKERTWSHVGTGWFKFANNCTVRIDR